jgi:hypothetical protein
MLRKETKCKLLAQSKRKRKWRVERAILFKDPKGGGNLNILIAVPSLLVYRSRFLDPERIVDEYFLNDVLHTQK